MKTYICDYAISDPITVAYYIEQAFFGCSVICIDVDEDRFEVDVYGVTDLDELDDVVAEFLYNDPNDKWWED